MAWFQVVSAAALCASELDRWPKRPRPVPDRHEVLLRPTGWLVIVPRGTTEVDGSTPPTRLDSLPLSQTNRNIGSRSRWSSGRWGTRAVAGRGPRPWPTPATAIAAMGGLLVALLISGVLAAGLAPVAHRLGAPTRAAPDKAAPDEEVMPTGP